MVYYRRSKLSLATLLLGLATASACGGLDIPEIGSLLDRQPQVISSYPADGSTVSKDMQVAVEFSVPIDPASINIQNLIVSKMDGDLPSEPDIVKMLDDGALKGSRGDYSVDDDRLIARYEPEIAFEAGARYLIVATDGVVSEDGIPFNQLPGGKPTPFVSSFQITDGAQQSSSVNPENLSGNASPDDRLEIDGDDIEPNVTRPNRIVINEIIYDVSGADTDGDLFIELFGDPLADISGYKIIFINGSDGAITGQLEIPNNTTIPIDGIYLIADAITGDAASTHVAEAELIKNFDPQNGPDSVQLLDDKGYLLDALGYGSPIVDVAKNNLPTREGVSAPLASAGKSLSRTDGADSGDNSLDFKLLDQPTPGQL